MGTSIVSEDCELTISCNSPQNATVVSNPCSENAVCIIDEDHGSSCVCADGFSGNGYECIKSNFDFTEINKYIFNTKKSNISL